MDQRTLSHYEIIEKLGAGGMGEVYRARDTKLSREVAIKVLPTVLADDPERRARFEREARTLATLQHANIDREVVAVEIATDTGFAFGSTRNAFQRKHEGQCGHGLRREQRRAKIPHQRAPAHRPQ